ncbi:MAG: DUF5357 domain-containing protein [Symploca sp. SIO2C1]|nr:DUF5357 domain-containing protein [Symploca sp. SIO2C1]
MFKFIRESIEFLLTVVLLGWVGNSVKRTVNMFIPPSIFSYQTLILLSIFSYLMSLFTDGIIRKLLFCMVGIFLIMGVYWGTTANKKLWLYRDPKAKPKKEGLPLSPWITGVIVCIYLFVMFPMLFFGTTPESGGQAALVSWPIISAIIAAVPNFMGLEKDELVAKTPPPPKRQNLVILFGINILLSCWFQFYFVIQNWLIQYPSLLADDFKDSAFVINIAPTQSQQPRGVEILEAMESPLNEQLNGKLWSEVEKLLLKEEREKWVTDIADKAKIKLSPVQEDRLWKVNSDVSSRDSGYNLELQAIWEGPRSKSAESYPIQKSCQITQVYPQAVATSNVECEPVKGEAGGNEPFTN